MFRSELQSKTDVKSVFEEACHNGLFEITVDYADLLDAFGTQGALDAALNWIKSKGVQAVKCELYISPPAYYAGDSGSYISAIKFNWSNKN